MVKGSTRQVIVVREPDGEMFEQAIFLLKENVPEVGEQELLAEARRIAAVPSKRRKHLPPLLWFLLGTVPVLLAWGLTVILS